MIRCPKCNTELPEGARFCAKCGESTKHQSIPASSSTPKKEEAAKNATAFKTTILQTPFMFPQAIPNTPTQEVPATPTPSHTVHPATKYTPPARPASDKMKAIPPVTTRPTEPLASPAAPEKKQSEIESKGKEQSAQFAQPKTLLARPTSGQVTLPAPLTAQGKTLASQPPRSHPAQPTSQAYAGPRQKPAPTQQRIPPLPQSTWVEHDQARQPEQMVRSSTQPPTRPAGTMNGNGYAPDPAFIAEENIVSFAATSKAVERWRSSWRDLQRAEAGPATGVSRGHASVPEPLLAMQNSFARMRAIIMPGRQQQKQQKRAADFRFWMTVFLMVCLMGGLAAYVVSTYLPNARLAASVAPAGDTPPASLSIAGTQSATFTPGQLIRLHGENFGANDTITFLLDMNVPITDHGGKQLSTQSNSHGQFTITLSIGSAWSIGPHLIQAQDSHTDQSAYLNIQIGLGDTPVASSDKLALSINGKPISSTLTFHATVGQPNPGGERITLTNISGTPFQWSVMAIADNNLGWLVLDKANTQGVLDTQGTDSIGVGILASSLQSRATPYKGRLIFTINGTEQLTLPVQLQVRDSKAEVAISPNPVIGIANADGTCKAGMTLTLINLSNEVITWDVQTSSTQDQNFLQFNGKPGLNGELTPSGQTDDILVINVSCTGVHAGQNIPLRVGYNGLSQTIPVYIQ